MIKEIITDEEILSQRSEEIDTRKQNAEMRQIINMLNNYELLLRLSKPYFLD